jgi:hypothetical protein
MAGLRGSQAQWAYAKQTAKGTPATKWEDGFFFTDGNLGPTKQTDQLAETDANRNAGNFFVTQTGAEGQPSAYVRTEGIQHILEAAMGSVVHSGTTPKFIHTITPAASLPYIMLGKAQGGVLFEQFNDCKLDELSFSWATGQPGTFSASFMGREAKRLVATWTGELALATKAIPSVRPPVSFNQATVKQNGVETRLASSFELTISNNLTVQQTDDSIPFDIVEGTFGVTFGYDYIVQDLVEYNKFNYGGESGTEQKPEIYEGENLTVAFAQEAENNIVEFKVPKYAYTEFPVEPDAGGAPTTSAVRGASQRSSEGFLSAVVKNTTEK